MAQGTLYIVATPIGHLGDLSQRAIETLDSVDLIAAEDTRHSAVLLNHYGIKTPMQSFHDHNEKQATRSMIDRLLDGASVALISDAGTPLISDPGYTLLDAAHAVNIRVVPIAGPSAATAAMSVAGLPVDRFVFEGFLPARPQARLEKLRQLQAETRTMVFYESPNRVRQAFHSLLEVMGPDRPVTLAREMTKLHEQIRRSTVSGICQLLQTGDVPCRGEFVIVLAGSDKPGDGYDLTRLVVELLAELPPSKVATLAHRLTGVARKKIYDLALAVKHR